MASMNRSDYSSRGFKMAKIGTNNTSVTVDNWNRAKDNKTDKQIAYSVDGVKSKISSTKLEPIVKK